MNLRKFIKELKTEYPFLSIYLYIEKNSLILAKIRLKNKYKGKGYGTIIMQNICLFADKNNLQIKLIPSDIYGGCLERLIKFYHSFGFNFTDSEIMVRNPKPYKF